MLTYRQVFDSFIQLEEELDLFQIKINDIYIWERIRFGVFRDLLTQLGLQDDPQPRARTDLAYLFSGVGNALRYSILNSPFCNSRADFMFIGHPRRKKLNDGNWWDIYCDHFIRQMGKGFAYFESSFQGRHFSPPATPNIRYLDSLDISTGIARRILRPLPWLRADIHATLTSVEEVFSTRFCTAVKIRQRAWDVLLTRQVQRPMYKQILSRVRPKVLFLVVSYGKETLIEAAKELCIPTVELQHGIISPYSLAYSFSSAKSQKHTFPDYFFAFGEFWKSLISWPIRREKVISVGFPHFELHRASYAHIRPKRQILFISQRTIGINLSKFASELAMLDDFSYDIIYKLHPRENKNWEKVYPWLKRPNIRVVSGNTPDLYELFAESQVQIGCNSTALFEGLGFGLQTFLIEYPGVELMQAAINRHYVSTVREPAELISALRSLHQPPFVADEIFLPSSLSNFFRATEQIAAQTI